MGVSARYPNEGQKVARTIRRDPNTHGTTTKTDKTACKGKKCYCVKTWNGGQIPARDKRRMMEDND